MDTYIVIDNATGIIVNRIVLDDPASWAMPEGHSIVAETEPMEIGGTYVDGVYTPPVTPPVPEPAPPYVDANVRIDAGINAAIDAAEAVRSSIHAIPANFNAANFQAFLIQAKALSDAFVAMLTAQQVEK